VDLETNSVAQTCKSSTESAREPKTTQNLGFHPCLKDPHSRLASPPLSVDHVGFCHAAVVFCLVACSSSVCPIVCRLHHTASPSCTSPFAHLAVTLVAASYRRSHDSLFTSRLLLPLVVALCGYGLWFARLGYFILMKVYYVF